MIPKNEYLKLVYQGKQATNATVFSHAFKSATWSIGFYFIVTGYFFTWKLLDHYHKLLFVCFIFLFQFVIGCFIYYCKTVHEKNALIIKAIDENSGAFKEGDLLSHGALYPEEWKNYGSNISYYDYGMLYPTTISAIIAITIIIMAY